MYNEISNLDNNEDKKSYYEMLEAITKDDLFDGLLGYGLFAEKIPPFLTAESFLSFCKSNNKNIANDKKSDYIQYQNIRNINIPRILSIPNPFAYYNQCKILPDNWDKLLDYFKKETKGNKHKISRIHLRKLKDKKHLFEMNYKNTETDDYPEPSLLVGKGYVVETDITNCFPSIYTHSICWALTSKDEAKQQRNDKKLWSNQIDKSTQNLKYGETHGILIGCHSSNIIAEIILVNIDNKMYEKGYRYIRNIDDYKCYVETYEKAEQFLIDLASELREYDLALNLKKTKILKLPLASTTNWVRKLNLFAFPNNRYLENNAQKHNEYIENYEAENDNILKDDSKQQVVNFSTLQAYLDTALDLMAKNDENSAILKYAIKTISNKNLSLNAKKYLIKTIHHLVLIYPYLVGILDEHIFSAFNIEKQEIATISQDIFNFGKNKNMYESMSYALYFALKYKIKLELKNLYELVKDSKDTILLLLAFLYDKANNNLIDNYINLSKELFIDINKYWLFVYEVLDLATFKNMQINEIPYLNEWIKLKKEKISFINKDFLQNTNDNTKFH